MLMADIIKHTLSVAAKIAHRAVIAHSARQHHGRGAQRAKLTDKLSRLTGKTIDLACRVDPSVLGGMRLDYDGKRVDDTVSHRLDAIRNMLRSTVL